MFILGLVIIAGGFITATYKLPRAKTKSKHRLEVAAGIIALGVAVGGFSQLPSQVEGPTAQHSTPPTERLAALTYHRDQEITINNNPGFTQSELDTSNGAWTHFSDLDDLNRVGVASAMLNRRLKPTAPRERLVVKPTGWHQKMVDGQPLFNRSHLIGFQLSGENNNLKNLMTGTRSLNAPLMQAHENAIAAYLAQNPKHYVRYEVTPVFRGNELLARGVAMRAQSVGDDAIAFNVYIFNVQGGVQLNYADGTSKRG